MADDNTHAGDSRSWTQRPEPSHAAKFRGGNNEFGEVLDSIQGPGSFSLSELFSKAPDPGMFLTNGHKIDFPLSHLDAQAAIVASKDHSMDDGEDELDLAFSQLWGKWDLFPDCFELRNPAWEFLIQSIVAKISYCLGVDATGEGLSAQLEKMVLYEQGSTFQPTEDFEDELDPSTFATLLITLPSERKGVELYLTHEGQNLVFPVSGTSDQARFLDVNQARPFASRRVILAYSLAHTTLTFRQWTVDFNTSVEILKELQSRQQSSSKTPLSTPESLAFMLENKYTNENLRYDSLEDHDYQKVSVLRHVFKESGFCIYLANISRDVRGGFDNDGIHKLGHFHPITKVNQTTAELTKIATLDGVELASDVYFDEDIWFPAKPFEDVDPDREQYVHYLGDVISHIHSRTIVVLVRYSRRVEFCFPIEKDSRSYGPYRMNSPLLAWIERASALLKENKDDNEARDDLERICELVIRSGSDEKVKNAVRESPAKFSDEVFSRNVQVALDLDDETLFFRTFCNRAGKAPPAICPPLGVGLLRYDLRSLLPHAANMLSTVNRLSIRLGMIDGIYEGLRTEAKDSSKNPATYLEWLRSEIARTLSSDQLVAASAEEGCGLVQLSIEASNQQIFNDILRAVKRNVYNRSMALAFLVDIFEAGQSGKISEDISQTVFKDVFSEFVESFHHVCGLGSSPASSPPIPYSFQLKRTNANLSQDKPTSRRFALMICNSLSLGLEEDMQRLVMNLIREAVPGHLCGFESIYLPAFSYLGLMLKDREYGIQNSSIAKLVRSILTTRIADYAKAEPVPSDDWKRRKVRCTCKDCSDLNTFLRDSTQHVWRLAASQRRRLHVQNQLCSRVEHYNIETERYESPHTMVVTKNKVRYFELHKSWVARCNVVKKELQGLDQDFLRLCFGEKYDAVVSVNMDVILPAHKELVDGVQALAEKDPPSRVPSPISKRKVSASAKLPGKSPEKAQF